MKNVYFDLRGFIFGQLDGLKAAGDLPADAKLDAVVLEEPRDAAHGDLACNAAMVLAKAAGVAPRVLAEKLVSLIGAHSAVEAVEIAGAGFLNIQLKTQTLVDETAAMLGDVQSWALAPAPLAKRALVEFVSINPTGPIHVGHGRNAVFGDVIARLLARNGVDVAREYLMNDAGGQMRVLVRSLRARYGQLFGEDVQVPADGYPGEYMVEIAEQLKAKDGDKWLSVAMDDVDGLYAGLREFAATACMDMIKADIETLGIGFDRYFSEYAMHQTGALADVVAKLRAQGDVYEGILPPPKGKEVADYTPVELTLFKATNYGLSEGQPIYNRAGAPTYFGQDIAYHWDKLSRGYDLLVTVVGAEQSGSFTPLGKALKALTGREDVLKPVYYEMVKVLRDGQPVKLSKRAGNIVLLSDVLREVGVDAFRFTMLQVKPTTQLVFDLGKAVAKNMENPVFYAQYAHARLASVFRQRDELGVTGGVVKAKLLSADARAVLKTALMYGQVLEQAARALEPHRVATYCTQLAGAVHRWYAAEKWLDAADADGTATRLRVAAAAQAVLADALGVCGVSAPEKM